MNKQTVTNGSLNKDGANSITYSLSARESRTDGGRTDRHGGRRKGKGKETEDKPKTANNHADPGECVYSFSQSGARPKDAGVRGQAAERRICHVYKAL